MQSSGVYEGEEVKGDVFQEGGEELILLVQESCSLAVPWEHSPNPHVAPVWNPCHIKAVAGKWEQHELYKRGPFPHAFPQTLALEEEARPGRGRWRVGRRSEGLTRLFLSLCCWSGPTGRSGKPLRCMGDWI